VRLLRPQAKLRRGLQAPPLTTNYEIVAGAFDYLLGFLLERLNPQTRTARARILVATPDRDLRPETFVHVDIQVALGRKLAVPAEAVFDTGQRQFVFVFRGAGTFEPRTVALGPRADGDFEVLSGVTEGEEVVASANFLIDSESRFRAAVAAFAKSPPAAQAE
jgi:multidrug efflux pump subunit AcrA (membrane-fusion protein)